MVATNTIALTAKRMPALVMITLTMMRMAMAMPRLMNPLRCRTPGNDTAATPVATATSGAAAATATSTTATSAAARVSLN